MHCKIGVEYKSSGGDIHGYALRFIQHNLRIRYTRNKKQPGLSVHSQTWLLFMEVRGISSGA